jgi:hypothetical protein
LELELLYAPQGYSKVLFYHNDFAGQLNLSQLDVDMALYGHIHSNNGSIYTTPYNLATDNICDNDRAYRVIKVNNGELQPLNTLYAGSAGNKITVDFDPSNTGEADSVVATITNLQPYGFENSLVKFNMPKGNYNYLVENGELLQIDSSGNHAVCYVKVNLVANNTLSVSVSTDSLTVIEEQFEDMALEIFPPSPNPFHTEVSLSFWLEYPQKVKLEIFDLSGNRVKVLLENEDVVGYYSVSWDGIGSDGCAMNNNIYLCRFTFGNGYSKAIRLVKL